MRNKLKVIHLIHQLGTGGAENGLINLVNNLDTSFFEPFICAFQGGGLQTEKVDRSRVELYELSKKDGNDPSFPFHLWRLFKKCRPDIVHTHSWGTLLEGFIAAKMAMIPIVIHGEHGTIQSKPFNIFLQRFFWGKVDHLLSVSNVHANKLAKVIGIQNSKITVIKNGVDTNLFLQGRSKILRASFGLEPFDVVIGTVGRLVPVKDQASMIYAFSKLSAELPNAKLLIVGDGPLRDELQNLSRTLGVSSKVVFLGRRSDIPDIIRLMDIFVLSSISEGMSNTILEAMSASLPVVATAVGGNTELIVSEKTGLLFPEGDIQKFTDALKEMIINRKRAKDMGVAGRVRVEKEFSLKVMVRNYEDLYKAVARNKGLIAN